ncbi:hypothetical protein AB7179_18555 [Providencia manganoxydans]|uniref:hypothetical protein n=1 Tax=Providencia manganoxydans TaxID=2923283 RepID=UPI001DBAF6F4|nr:hypothetical protein [Providencia rettgeri]EIJ7167979.1 hypothetical protein [Providencia rettgeri]EMA4783776.1 hypothetical protein [Providencia rettgeri]
MKIFTSNPIVHAPLITSNIYSSSYIPSSNITKNLGMVKVVISEIWDKFKDEDEVAKVELINLTKEKGGNAIINFKYETGTFQRTGSGSVSSYIVAYGDAVFIEYND